MFYNTYRTTKSSMLSADKNNKSVEGRNVLNQRERLLNLQKRQKLKDLLITKFMQKYKIKNYEKIMEDEITKFLQGEKLTERDLKKLDTKIRNLLEATDAKERLKKRLTQSFQENQLKKDILPKIETNKLNIDNTLSPRIINPRPKILNTEQIGNTLEPRSLSTSMKNPLNTFCSRRKYKKPEEELAELEAEFAKDEEMNKKNIKRLDFSKEGDEWNAIALYNRKIYEDQIKQEKIKDEELKRRNKADLDLQVKQKLRREYEEELKEKEYDKMMKEHQKELDEIDRKKQEDIKKQVLKEKESRDEQMRQNYMMKRIEYLKEKKFEKSLLKSIQEGLEKEKLDAIEKKKKENEALVKAVKENDLKMKLKKEKEKREKEEDVKMGKERMIMQMKEDNKRQRYYDMIRSYGNKLSEKSNEIIAKIKKDQEEEDKRIHHYYVEKNKLEMEKEKREELKKSQQKYELKKYLDMQIEEKKKEDEFLKSLDYEQARIWAIDCKKYNDDEKEIQNKLRTMNKRNMKILMDQINKKKSKNKNNMSDNEYAMNKNLLEKAKVTLSE